MKKQMMMLVLVVLLSVANVASATVMTFYVDDDATGYNNGSSWSDAFTELQSTLDVAIAGDQIWVAEGTYYPTSDYGLAIGNRGRHFRMINGVEIYGGFAGSETTLAQRNVGNNETILSGDLLVNDNPNTVVEELNNDPNRTDNCYHVFYHPDGLALDPNAILDGFTITAGNADGSGIHGRGGGMYNDNNSPTVTNCTFSGNSAKNGGGMYNDNASNPTLTNCTFSENSANGGGGMYNRTNSSPTLTNCTFSENLANSNGGGMYNRNNSSPTVTNCTFSGNNTVNAAGGGMYNIIFSSPIVTNCTFVGNLATTKGGGMRNYQSSSPTVTNCTFSGNWAVNTGGGGMHNWNSSNPTVTGCTFSGNSGRDGGGMANRTNSNPTVTNCTFSGNNSARRGGGMSNRDGGSPTVTNCTFSGNNSAIHGGGMSNKDGCSPTVTNCTFSGNTANNQGGGMNNKQYSSPIVTNCILWGNTASENNEIRGTASVSYSCVQDGYTGSGNIDTDPQFVDADGLDDIIGTEDDNLRLLSWSQCIDAGDPNYVLDPNYPTDLDGNPRIVNGIVDMGAYELQPDLIVTSEDITFVPDSPVEPGTIIVVSAEIHNVGTEDMNSFVVRFFNGDPDSGGTQIGVDQQVASLAGGASEIVSVAFTTSPELQSYEIFILADADFQIEEVNKTNNKAFRILTAGPDLVLTSSDISFSADVAGEVRITAEVHNVGIGNVDEQIEVAFYNGDPETGGTDIGNATIIGGIAEGLSGITDIEWSNPPLGTYNLYVVVDPGSEIIETTKANNKAFNTLSASLDLTLTSGDISFNPDPSMLGQQIEISAAIHNSGFLACEEFLVKLYDGDPDAGGTELGAEIVEGIAGLGSAQVSILSAFTSHGKHEIYVAVDPNNAVEETNEDNNLASNSLYVQYATIQETIDAASPGDTVYIGPRTYNENVLINKSITLVGAGSATTIIDGGGTGDVILVTADNVTIRGFTVQNSIGDGSGIHLRASGANVSENIITQCYFGIFADYSSGSYVAHNTVTANSYGVYCEYASGDAIRYNTITNNTLYGAKSYNSSLANCFNWNYFSGNPVGYSYDPEVPVGPLLFDGNVLQDNEIGIEVKDTSASDLVFSDNTITGSDIGVFCENADPIIKDNALSSNNSAIYLVNSSSLIEGNVISENTTGIVYDESSEPILIDNTMSGNVANENTIPMANAGIDQTDECAYNTDQGTKVTLNGTDSYDPDEDPLTYTWTGPFVESPSEEAMPTVTLVDGCPGDYAITLVVNDGLEDSQTDEVVITVVDTTAPVISGLDADYLLAAVGQAVTFSVSVSDNCDSNVDLQWDFGDTASASGASPVHSYSSGGIYTVSVTAEDSCGNTSTDDIIVVVYDPSAGFTTGGGWFVPDSESRIGGELVTDTVSKANFGFVVKYKKGADDPDGKLEFQYKAGDIDLKSTDMEWLVVQSASKVSFKGKAIINGEDVHTFKVTADDNGEPGAGVDKFKIEIWLGVEEDVENTNQTPKHTAKGVLGGGNIQIHQK